ncbi:MAG: DUF222 domain-containing protein [Acidimicrobiia bacterium]|nr:DUF222 domain-containing protein [Acidimicrobiia bacterium]
MSANASLLHHPPPVVSPDLRTRVLAVGRSWSRAQHRLVHLLAERDRSGEWALDGARTCAHWVAAALDVEVATAREWLRVGRSLATLARVDAAFGDGRISYSKVRLLSRVATADNEVDLLAVAERTPAGRLAVEIARWLTRRESPDETERRQHAARALTWRIEPDGMILGALRLPPAVAAALITAIDTWIMRRPAPEPTPLTECAADASADASAPPWVTGWPSVAQQRADGLVALLAGGGAVVDTEVVLHVRGDGCTLDDGTPVAGSVVERVAPASFLRVLIHDAERRPVNASGRHRHPTARQRRLVHERDRGCVDCGVTTLLELDHEPGFALTGRTVVDELHERCWTCHHARHRSEES